MTIDNWLAIATGSLAAAAFWAIWQNYRFKREEKDFRLKTNALNDIHQWLLNILATTNLYLTSVREGDEKQKFLTKSQCDNVSIRGGDMLVAAGIFGADLLEKIKRVDRATMEYQKSLDNITPGETSIKDKIVNNFAEALSDAFTSIGIEKVKMLPEYFHKRGNTKK